MTRSSSKVDPTTSDGAKDSGRHFDKENTNIASTSPSKQVLNKAQLTALNDKLKRLIQEGELELEERCANLTSKANVYCTKIENAFALQIMRLPKSVQSLPLEEFKNTYGFSVSAAIKNIGGTKRKAGAIGTTYQAPAKGMVVPQTPSTRTVNAALSNFSAIKTSFVRRQRPGNMPDGNNSASAKDDAPKIELELTDAITGKQINASDPDAAKGLNDESKQEVLNHLSSLQNQISDLMKQFT